MNRVDFKGRVLGFLPLKRHSKLSDLEHQRIYLRRTKRQAIRSRQQTYPVIGVDPMEQRAAAVKGSILERIVYKKLTQILGPEGARWKYKFGVAGTRVFAGGRELDFEINVGVKPIDLEVQGFYWHGPTQKWSDTARALEIMGYGYDYVEILEREIMVGDEYLEFRLRQLLGL